MQTCKTHLLISVGIIILIISCKQKETQKVESKNKIEETIFTKQYIENDSLLMLLKSDLYRMAFNPVFEGEEKPEINTHNKTVADTSKTLIFDKTKIHFYRESNWEIIVSAKIKNSRFKFLETINIGEKKEILENIVKTELKANSITIGNLKHTTLFIFKFENDILKEIVYKYDEG